MDYKRTPEWWVENEHKPGEQLARENGGDGAHWRRAKRTYCGTTLAPTKIIRGICVFDLHHPKHDKKLWNNILRFTEDFAPDAFVFGGDNQDLEVVSHWVGQKRRVVEGKRLKKDYSDFNTQILAPLDAVLAADAERIFHLGNHEDWVEQYIDCHPEVEGFFEIRNNLNLDNWQVYDYGEVSSIGKLHFTHGTYINIHNAYKTAQVYGRNIVYGHGHTYQAHTITAPLDTHSHCATQIPCACGLNPSYRLNQPNAWVNGFGVFYVLPNGNFSLIPVIATDGCFISPDGVLYD